MNLILFLIAGCHILDGINSEVLSKYSTSTLPGGPHESIHDTLWPTVQHQSINVNYDSHPFDIKHRKLDDVAYGSSASYSTIRIKIDTSSLSPDQDDEAACRYTGDKYIYTSGSSRYQSTCTKDDVATTEKMNYLKYTILPKALEYYETHLRVVPTSAGLKFTPRCLYTISGQPCCDSHPSQCSFESENKCHNTNIPASYTTTSGAGTDIDFVLFVTMRPTQGSTLAWAATCRSDQFGRPVAGQANFGPNRISTDPTALAETVSTAIHEIAHALGFSSSKFSHFRDHSTGLVRGSENVISSYTQNSKTVQKIITPTVVEKVRQHFGCSTLDGAELEDSGGSGSAGSHFEKRIFGNEFMTATSSADSIFSAISLAVFHDSGWYRVDFGAAQELPWGNDQGCSFALQRCSSWPQSAKDAGFFCTDSNQKKCTGKGYTTKGYCNLVTYSSSLDSAFRYFSSSSKGGKNQYADFCPHIAAYSNGDCRDTNNSPGNDYYGEIYGSSSTCFESSLLNSRYTSSGSDVGTRCHQYRCTSSGSLTTLEIKVSSTWINCPRSGGSVPVTGYHNTLQCPPTSERCASSEGQSATCASSCSNRGTCVVGKCNCNTGYSGTVCENKECPSACSNHGSCNQNTGECSCASGYIGSSCQTCSSGFELHSDGITCTLKQNSCPNDCSGHGTCGEAGVCSCEQEYESTDCSDRSCPSPTCSGHGTCSLATGTCSCSTGYSGNSCLTAVAQPKTCPNDCTSALRGDCDESTGTCICEDGYQGIDCSGADSSSQVLLVSGTVTTAMSVAKDGYVYFRLNNVPAADTVSVVVDAKTGDPDLYVSVAYENPTSAKFQLKKTETGGESVTINAGACDSACTYYFAVKGYNAATFTMLATQSSASCTAASTCNGHGTCEQDGSCKCTTPFSGISCATAECPSSSIVVDCSGHGSCVRTSGNCICSTGYEGTDCSTSTSTDTGGEDEPTNSGAKQDTTYTRTGHAPTEWKHVTIDMSNQNLATKSMTVTLERTDEKSSDPMLFLRKGAEASKTGDSSFAYDAFDAATWRSDGTTQTVTVSGASGTLTAGTWYVSVYNWDKYLSSPASYKLRVNIVTQSSQQIAACTRDGYCNGNGSCKDMSCTCDAPFYGNTCTQKAVLLSSTSATSTPVQDLEPGQWSYFYFDTESGDDVTISMGTNSGSSVRPQLFVQHSTLPTTGDVARSFTDFPSFQANRQESIGKHTVRVANVEMRAGRWYVGIYNTETSTNNLNFNVQVTAVDSGTTNGVSTCGLSTIPTDSTDSTENIAIQCPNGGKILSIVQHDFFAHVASPFNSDCTNDKQDQFCHTTCHAAKSYCVGKSTCTINDVASFCDKEALQFDYCRDRTEFSLVLRATCSVGDSSSSPECDGENTCNGNGRCDMVNGRPTCSCLSSWTGSDCKTTSGSDFENANKFDPQTSSFKTPSFQYTSPAGASSAESSSSSDGSSIPRNGPSTMEGTGTLSATRKVSFNILLVGLSTLDATAGLATDQSWTKARENTFLQTLANVMERHVESVMIEGTPSNVDEADLAPPQRRRTEGLVGGKSRRRLYNGGVMIKINAWATDETDASSVVAKHAQLRANPTMVVYALQLNKGVDDHFDSLLEMELREAEVVEETPPSNTGGNNNGDNSGDGGNDTPSSNGSDNDPGESNGDAAGKNPIGNSSTSLMVLFICIGILVVVVAPIVIFVIVRRQRAASSSSSSSSTTDNVGMNNGGHNRGDSLFKDQDAKNTSNHQLWGKLPATTTSEVEVEMQNQTKN